MPHIYTPIDKTSNFHKLSLAAFLATALEESGPSAYMAIYQNSDLRKQLLHNPSEVELADIQCHVIKGFLNKERSRFPNNEESASAIRKVLEKTSPTLKALEGLRIESVDFDKVITAEPYEVSISEAITAIFEVIAQTHGHRTTVAAKLPGILNPPLFVMWDDSIASYYVASDDGKAYTEFLRKMQRLGQQRLRDFKARFNRNDLADYLSERLSFEPSKTLAKYLDEYNWITITRCIEVPPKWHPCDS